MKTNQSELSWSDWVSCNLARGCDPASMYELLLEGGHTHEEATQLLHPNKQSANQQICDVSAQVDQTSQSAANMVQQHSIYLPMANRLETYKAEVYVLENFLNEEECMHFIAEIKNDLLPSTVTSGCTKVRTSRTCNFEQAKDSVVAEIDQRICQYMGIPNTSAEKIQGQWYRPGEEFKAHTDYFEPDVPTSTQHLNHQGQRT